MVSTQNRGGGILHKRFTVFTNDPGAPSRELVVTGKVNAYVEVTPAYVRLMGKPGDNLQASVQILAQQGFPFTIKEVKARDGKDIQFDLKPMPKGPDGAEKGYTLTVRNTRTQPGFIRDFLSIETDLKEKPMINIPVSGRIFEPPAAGAQPGAKTQ